MYFLKEFFEFHPSQRRLENEEDEKYVNNLLTLRTPKSRIQDEVKSKFGKKVSGKDLQNRAQMLKDPHADNFKNAAKHLIETYCKSLILRLKIILIYYYVINEL